MNKLVSCLALLLASTALGQVRINYGDAIAGSISLGATDSYQFLGTSGEVIIILASAPCCFQPCIELLDPSGNSIGSSCNTSKTNRIDIKLTTSGPHQILVSDQPSNVEAGNYTLALERVFPSPSPNSRPLAFGQNLTDSMSPLGELDSFSFSAAAGKPIVVTASTTCCFQPCIELFDPSGMQAGAACNTSFTNTLRTTTTQAGLYVVVVYDQRSNVEAGNYTVDLQCLAASCRGPAQYTPFAQGCAGSAGTPTLAAAPGSLPVIGQVFTVALSSLPPSILNTPFMLLGFSQTSLNLDPIGMLGCTLLTSAEMVFTLNNSGGTASWSVVVPLDATLIGAQFFNQGAVFDPAANALGLTLSNGGAGVIG